VKSIDFARLLDDMVDRQIARRGVRSPIVLDAMRAVPREAFLPEPLREFAYDDAPLPIAEGQTISQPYIVALMTEALALEGGEKVLEIGTGSGYAAAVISRIARSVYTVERIGQLAEKNDPRVADSPQQRFKVDRVDPGEPFTRRCNGSDQRPFRSLAPLAGLRGRRSTVFRAPSLVAHERHEADLGDVLRLVLILGYAGNAQQLLDAAIASHGNDQPASNPELLLQ
jgi:hypothetical protein